MSEEVDDIWWVVSGGMLLQMLREVADGGDPGLVYIEHYANADIGDDD